MSTRPSKAPVQRACGEPERREARGEDDLRDDPVDREERARADSAIAYPDGGGDALSSNSRRGCRRRRSQRRHVIRLHFVQFAEMRYSGKPAAFLRGFRAIYLGLLMNCLILGWVTKAMTSIVAVTLGVSDGKALAICVLFLIPFTGLYVALGGLWGVLWTDLFQFALKMAIVIGVAWYAVAAAGGMSTLLARLAEMRTAAGPGAGDATAFFPDLSRPSTQEAIWVLPVWPSW